MTDSNTALVQGSPAWVNARLGRITASRFRDVLTEPRSKAARDAGELSATARTYLLDLAAETLTGQSQGIDKPTAAMQHGIDHEPVARELYEERAGCKVQQVGFYEHPLDPMIGGSPDGLVGEEGGLEIKCPWNTAIHLGYVLGGVLPKEHLAQVHGHLWLSGVAWWDFISFDPRIKDLGLALWRVRVYRDVKFLRRINEAVFAFRDRLLETLCELKGEKHD